MKRLLTHTLLVVQLFVGASASAQYADAPFKRVAIEPARALVEMVAINNWLNTNYSRITEHQAQGAREHLHALIDARVKESYTKQGALRAPEPDRQLAILYSWAGRLGVYGSDLVYAAVRGDHPISPPAGPRPPSGIGITLQGESLVLQSTDPSWRTAVPFHFFPFAIRDDVAADGQRTQAVAISTGTAQDTAPPGYSQATIALFYVQGANTSDFEQQWLLRFQMPSETATKSIELTNYQSRTAYDPISRLHKEVVFVQAEKGSFVVLFSGLDGTYQANRLHFADFLRLARLR